MKRTDDTLIVSVDVPGFDREGLDVTVTPQGLIVRGESRQPTEDRRKRGALVRSAETDAERMTVEVDGNAVILRGTVRSWAEREAAERVAWAAPGVAAVHNRITVSP